jgi:hypothetical protein
MFWRIHKAIFKNRFKDVIKILSDMGDEVQTRKGEMSFIPLPNKFDRNKPSFAITTIQDANMLIKTKAGIRLCYDNHNYNVSTWISYLRELGVVNSECYFLPLSLVIRLRPDKFPIFIKPDSGNKLFTGFVANTIDDILLHPDIAFYIINAPETICMINNVYRMPDIEWRLWIVDRKIAGYSPYSWSWGRKIPLAEPPTAIMELAEKVANTEWQPDIIYTVDIADGINGINNLPKIIEINAGSTSGFYNADLSKILMNIRNSISEGF